MLPLPDVQFSSDHLDDAGEIMQHVIAPEADDVVAAAREFGCPDGVFLLLLRVLAAIQLDHELARRTAKSTI
jgi:hypothetical protein